MSNKLSIIKNFKNENYNSYPFPFFEIENAYDEKTYSLLRKDYNLFHSYFKNDKKYNDNNIRLQISSKEFLNNNLFKKSIWHDFITYHSSKEFFLDLFEIFFEDMDKIYPDIVKIIENNKNNSNFLNLRGIENNDKYNFVSDCQPGINTPSKFKSTVRDSHVDSPVELLAGLFYLRDDGDNSIGGDLEIMENTSKKSVLFHNKAEVLNVHDLRVVKLIRYKKNKVVFFMNTVNSIHRVTPRESCELPRNLTNIIFETYNQKDNLFKVNYKKFFSF